MFLTKKVYGQSKIENCYFCSKNATTRNLQRLAVCKDHTQKKSINKCACGENLSVKESRFGTFFLCKNCGPISIKKAKENIDNSEYNINKKYRKNLEVEKKEKIYTLEELEELFDSEKEA